MKKILYIAVALIAFSSCKKEWLDLTPSDAVPAEQSIQNLLDAQVALNGAYNTLQSSDYYGADMVTYGDVRADDLRTYGPGNRTDDAYAYTHTTEASITGLWSTPFITISSVNNIIANIDGLEIQPNEVDEKNNVKGQALALRALAHFDLVRVHGQWYKAASADTDLGAPVVTVQIPADEMKTRNTVTETYNQIIKDLTDAIELLSEDRSNGYINKWAAKALLSRVYLYKGDNTNAFNMAADVIDNASAYNLIDKDSYVNSWSEAFTDESLFSVVNTGEDNADREALGYLYDVQGYGSITATDSFIEFMQADDTDVRLQLLKRDPRTADVEDDQRFGQLAKYPGLDGDSRVNNVPVIRLAEVYLIAAEAGLTENAGRAKEFINALHEARTGVADHYATATKESVIFERRKELVGEGHRFFDALRLSGEIIRTGSDHFCAPEEMEINTDDYYIVLPIPRYELNTNTNIQQNPGYQK